MKRTLSGRPLLRLRVGLMAGASLISISSAALAVDPGGYTTYGPMYTPLSSNTDIATVEEVNADKTQAGGISNNFAGPNGQTGQTGVYAYDSTGNVALLTSTGLSVGTFDQGPVSTLTSTKLTTGGVQITGITGAGVALFDANGNLSSYQGLTGENALTALEVSSNAAGNALNVSNNYTGDVTGVTRNTAALNLYGGADIHNGLRVHDGAVIGGGLTVKDGLTITNGGINNNGGGITNAGAISGATSITASGVIQGGTVTSTGALNGNSLNVGSSQQLTIDSSGNLQTTGTLQGNGITSTNGLTVTSGGANITGGTKTDTLNVASGALGNAVTISNNYTGDVTGVNSGSAALNLYGGADIHNGLRVHGGEVVGGGLTVKDGVTVTNGGASITGGTTTDTLNVTGASTTNGISNTGDISNSGNISTATLGVTGNATVGGTFGVTGLTSTNGISNTGNIATGTLNTTGLATLNSASVTNNLSVGGNQTVGGTFGVNGLATFNGGTSTTGNAVFKGTGANSDTTTINGAVATLTSSKGTITLNANVDPLISVTDGAGSTTTIQNGFVTITGGAGSNTSLTAANATTTFAGNAALKTSGGAVINNGLLANGGFVASGPAQGVSASYVSLGGNLVHDVATPVFGTDASNKAYVDATVRNAKNRAYEGTAVALAISQPMLLSGQTFAIRGGWGDFEGQNALGFSAAGVIGRDVFGYGSTLTVDAGVGVGTNYSGVGGKAGVTLGFGGGAAPLK